MKAYIKDEQQKKGRFNGHKYRLTIAMPVSNQVKTIRRCLDSLVPLLKAVPSELIITDTGSTDGTIEIAREYTDHIEHFPWCNDMSAARNVGLRAAQGEWFMSIDDDEWFDDVSEIIEFFNSGECDTYGCASYIQRNYAEIGGSFYSDFPTPRIARIIGDIHFEGRIHDTIIGRHNPLKMLHSYVNHYGFAYAKEEDHMAKFHRNLSGLLKDNEEFPHDLRYIYQIIKEYYSISDLKTAIEWCLKGLSTEKEYPDKIRCFEITVLLSKCYYHDNQFQLAMDVAEKFLMENKEIDTYHMDVYWLQVLIYMALHQYKQAIQSGLSYIDVYHKFKEGKLNNEMLLFGGCDSVAPQVYMETVFNITKCYFEVEDYDNSMLYFDKIDLSLMDKVLFEIVQIGLAIADKSRQYNRISDLYTKVKKTNDETEQIDFIKAIEVYIKQNRNVNTDVLKALAQTESDDPFIQLCKLRLADDDGKQEETISLIEWFVSSFTDWSPYYSDVLYIAMKQNLDITRFFDLVDVEDLKLYLNQIIGDHPNFVTIIMEYFIKHSYDDNLKGVYWSICSCERVALSNNKTDNECYDILFKKYALNIAAYAHNIYQPELFMNENILILPRVYRFGHYMQLAFMAKDNGNEVEYVKNLNAALQHYPVMKESIQALLENLETQHREQELQMNQQNNEFADLANRVKAQIEQFLLQEQYEQAAAVLAQLTELLPNDEDVKRYKLQIQSAQSLKEIGRTISQ